MAGDEGRENQRGINHQRPSAVVVTQDKPGQVGRLSRKARGHGSVAAASYSCFTSLRRRRTAAAAYEFRCSMRSGGRILPWQQTVQRLCDTGAAQKALGDAKTDSLNKARKYRQPI